MKRLVWFPLLCTGLLLAGCGDTPLPKTLPSEPPIEGTAFTVMGLSLDMLWCPPGTFQTGSPANENRRDNDEVLREVTLTRGFWLGKQEVTQSQWKSVMGTNPSHFKGPQLPVEKISWDRAKAFCEKLTKRERKARRLPRGWSYQLPTESQWEYACRAGTKTAWSFGDSPKETPQNANFADKSSGQDGAQMEYDDGFEFTAPVGSFPANPWGFHEMHGNVFEWCGDWYENHGPAPVRDPSGPLAGTERIFRGGCWALPSVFTRSARRDKHRPILESAFVGFRVSLSWAQTQK
ncbi:MAG: formylglycine-generating enzyme family protein [Opitutales bacterium]